MLYLFILYRKVVKIMKKLLVTDKYDGKKISKFILDTYPYLSVTNNFFIILTKKT